MMPCLGISSPYWWKVITVVILLHIAFLYFIAMSPNGKVESKTDNLDGITVQMSTLNPKSRRLVNKLIPEYDHRVQSRLRTLVEEKVSSDDPRLVSLIKDLLDPPSNHIVKTVRQIIHTPQSTEVVRVLEQRQSGFFVECGALDGERSSNTLYLEQRMGWNGLLVEMDPFFYTQLRGKSRRAWSINACLSPFNYPTVMDFAESSGGGGKLLGNRTDGHQGVTRKVPCFPFSSLMLALNQSKVDFFSLDVEGFEMEILRTVPFDKIDISVLAVEYVHGKSGKRAYLEFMREKGYMVHKDIHFHDMKVAMFVDDFIFVKKSLVPSFS